MNRRSFFGVLSGVLFGATGQSKEIPYSGRELPLVDREFLLNAVCMEAPKTETFQFVSCSCGGQKDVADAHRWQFIVKEDKNIEILVFYEITVTSLHRLRVLYLKKHMDENLYKLKAMHVRWPVERDDSHGVLTCIDGEVTVFYA
jgi:hypothetical protein